MPYWHFKGWTFSCHNDWRLEGVHAQALSDVMAIIQNKLQRATTPMKNTSIRMRSVIATILTIVCIQSDLALGYMGAKDKNDWSQGPSCSAQDSKNPNMYHDVPCNDAQTMMFFERSAVPNAIHHAKFDELERLYAEWSKSQERFGDGMRKSSMLCRWISANWEYIDPRQGPEKVRVWQEMAKRSFLSQYAEAVYWRSAAWSARGDGFSDSVTKEGRQLFQERLSRGYDLLNKIPADLSNTPCWYSQKINMMLELGLPTEDIEAVYAEGTKRFPEDHNIYFSMSRVYSPMWRGDDEIYDRFVTNAVEKTKAFEGTSLYARLYWMVDHRNGLPFRDELNSQPTWSKLRSAYLDMMQKYPESVRNRNRFAAVTCRTKDSSLYRTLRASLKGAFVEELFNPGLRDTCDLKHKWQNKE